MSLAPCVRCDVRGAELQVGQTVWAWSWLCQLYRGDGEQSDRPN